MGKTQAELAFETADLTLFGVELRLLSPAAKELMI